MTTVSIGTDFSALSRFIKEEPRQIPVNFENLTPQQYLFDYIEPLLKRGVVMAKTRSPLASKIGHASIITLDDLKHVETSVNIHAMMPIKKGGEIIGWEPAFLIADPSELDDVCSRALIAQHIIDPAAKMAFFMNFLADPKAESERRFTVLRDHVGMQMGRQMVSSGEVCSGAYAGPNLWLNGEGKFRSSYVVEPGATLSKPFWALPNRENNGDLRLVLPVSKAIN